MIFQDFNLVYFFPSLEVSLLSNVVIPFQLAQEERDLKRQKKNHEFHIKLEMRERQRKRLRIAQSIQRELGECEVRQVELETRAISVEKKMEQLKSGK